MKNLYLRPTSLAQWHALVQDAEQISGKQLAEELENYLVLLLQKFADKPEVAQSIFALDYLNIQSAQHSQQPAQLRDLGDRCLLFSGLFPERATKHHVTVSYFVQIGKKAYQLLAQRVESRQAAAELFHELDLHFVILMDTLQYIREMASEDQILSPIQAEELWRSTGSEHALQILRSYTRDSLPLRLFSDDLH